MPVPPYPEYLMEYPMCTYYKECKGKITEDYKNTEIRIPRSHNEK